MNQLSELSLRASNLSRETLNRVGSFLGVTENDNELDNWQHKLNHRAQSGQVGIHLPKCTWGKRRQTDIIMGETEIQLENFNTFTDKCNESNNSKKKNKLGEFNTSMHGQNASLMISYDDDKIEDEIISHKVRKEPKKICGTLQRSTSEMGSSDSLLVVKTERKASLPVMGSSTSRIVMSQASSSSQSVTFISDETNQTNCQSIIHSEQNSKSQKDGDDINVDEKGDIDHTESPFHSIFENNKQTCIEAIEKAQQDTKYETVPRLTLPIRSVTTRRMYTEDRENLQRRLQSTDRIPWLTFFISTVHVIMMIVVICLLKFAPIALEPELRVDSNILTQHGNPQISHWITPNVWMGPYPRSLISFGAVYAPCMRDDIGVNMKYARQGYDITVMLGCCEIRAIQIALTSTLLECQLMANNTGFSVTWGGTVCSERAHTVGQIPSNIHPCCYGIQGQCLMTTQEHCAFIHGFFHHNDDHCLKVNCLSSVCNIRDLPADQNLPYKPGNPNQLWRPLVALFLHHGVLHVLIILFLQLTVVSHIEAIAGWFRVLIIFILTGSMGLMVGSLFNPYVPQCGGGGAVMGFLAVLLVEIIQSWTILYKPYIELFKIMVTLLLFILIGTIPLVDNMTFFGGFLFGIPTAIVFLPYITFGKWQVIRRRILIAISLPILVIMFLIVIFLFVQVQTIDKVCFWCQKINCVPYTKHACNIS